MTLINCPECDKEVSDKAPMCPNCGYPVASSLNPGIGKVDIGDCVTFGEYGQSSSKKEPIKGRVLDIQGNKVLLISNQALDCKPFNKDCVDTTGAECDLRQWLNGPFLDNAFSSAEQNKIAVTNVQPQANPSFSSNQGISTQDKIFLLNIQEVERYFSSDNDRICHPTQFAVDNNCHLSDTGACSWWLRSSGLFQNDTAEVIGIGYVGRGGGYVNDVGDGVRPALGLNL